MKSLFYVALAVSIVGLFILFFITPSVSPQSIMVSGMVKKIDNRGKVSFITFVPDDFVVVSFDRLNLSEGRYSFVGRLQSYKGKVEFVVEKVV
ncbi:hypothetical protein DRJ22_04290 [Candidatus Woesearchaeota archaeon]|nr:MAG: hypothetical protein DRJ22_04290 [Candidatus Woesearchaeota archaeon]